MPLPKRAQRFPYRFHGFTLRVIVFSLARVRLPVVSTLILPGTIALSADHFRLLCLFRRPNHSHLVCFTGTRTLLADSIELRYNTNLSVACWLSELEPNFFTTCTFFECHFRRWELR